MQNVKDGASDDAGKKEVKEEEGPGYYNEASALMDFKGTRAKMHTHTYKDRSG